MAFATASRGGSYFAFTMLAAATLAASSAPATARVGVTSGADGKPLGKPPNESERILRIGIDVQANEVITTSANDRAHLVFIDGSSLTVGPNAQLTIDRFVFDPTTRTGDLAINASKGVLRLVGGKISKTGPITINTPSATIGIRGGIAVLTVTPAETVADFVFGTSMTVTRNGLTQTATRQGSQIVTRLGGPPGPPTLLKQGSLNAALGQLEGVAGTGNDSPDRAVQTSGFTQNNSGQPNISPQTLPPNLSNGTLTNAVSDSTAATQRKDTRSNGPPQIAAIPPGPPTGQTPSGPTPPAVPSGSTAGPTGAGSPPSSVPQVIVTYGRALQDQPYRPGAFNPYTLQAPRNLDNNKPLAASGSVLNSVATITIQGGDNLQVPWLPGRTVHFNGITPAGAASGVGFVSPDGKFFAYSFTTAESRNFVLFGGTPMDRQGFPTAGIGAQQLVSLNTPGDLPFAPKSVGGDPALKAAANASPLYTIYTPNQGAVPSGQGAPKGLQVTVSIAGTGAEQKSYMGMFIADYGTDYATNSIYSGGNYAGSYRLGADQGIGRLQSSQATAETGQGNALYAEAGGYMAYIPDRITTSDSGRETTRVNQAALDRPPNAPPTSYYPVTVPTPADQVTVSPTIGQKRTSQTQTGYLGGLVESTRNGQTSTRVPSALLTRPTDVRITTDAVTNQAIGTLVLRGLDGTLLSPTATLQLGGNRSARDPSSAFIDDNTYGMLTQKNDPGRQSSLHDGSGRRPIVDNTMLVSSNASAVPLPGSPGSCACEFLTWGWWSTSIVTSGGPNAGQVDRVNMGAYVAGTPTTQFQIPQTGSATYSGFMVGNVRNGSNSYISSGDYRMDWNFRVRGGAMSSSFDGTNYRGVAVAQPGSGGTQFSGALGGGGRLGAFNGSFFAAPGDAAKYQAGSFSIGGNTSSYKASGIFAGQR